MPAHAEKADDWPQLLGPRRDGISTETGLNLDWKANPPRTVWKKSPGSGFSSVAVVGDRLVTQAQRKDRQWIVCLSAKDGEELWAYDAAPGYIDRQHAGAGPRSTPTVAGDRAYCLFPRGELVCVTLDKGEEVWKTNIFDVAKAKDHFQDFYYWGLSQSPLVEGGLVIVQPGGDKDGSVVALDKDNGKVVWGVGSDPAGYGSPIAIDVGKKRMVVCPTGQSILGIDPVKGELLWRYAFGNFANATCATPVWSGELLFVSAAYGVGCAALEITPDGDKWTVHEKWSNKDLQTLMATGIVARRLRLRLSRRPRLVDAALPRPEDRGNQMERAPAVPLRLCRGGREPFRPDREGGAATDRDQPRQVRSEGRSPRPAGEPGVGHAGLVPQDALPARSRQPPLRGPRQGMRRSGSMTARFHLLILLGLTAVAPARADAPSAAGDEFFEKEVRPLLVERCLKCHGGEKTRGGLKLTSRDAILQGGDTGPAAVPGKPDDSLLVQAAPPRRHDAGCRKKTSCPTTTSPF